MANGKVIFLFQSNEKEFMLHYKQVFNPSSSTAQSGQNIKLKSLRKHEFNKINWFSSIPEKFSDEIKEHLKNTKMDADEDQAYQIIVLPKLSFQ